MNDMVMRAHALRKQTIELSQEERVELNTIIDLLIPSNEDFPPPSSLSLIDEFLHHLTPDRPQKTALALNAQRLHAVLRELNTAAGGCFCDASPAAQHTLLRQLEQREPALFQALWTLANHSYYKHLATVQRPFNGDTQSFFKNI